MKALIIVACILLFIVALLSVRIRLYLRFSDALCLDLRVLFLRFRLHPKKLTPKRVIRMQKKQRKKAKKRLKRQAKAATATSARQEQPKQKPTPLAILRLFVHILRSIYRKFPDCFRLYIKRCVIVIAGKDAAETAIRYGAARGALAWFCELLDEVFTIKTTKKSVLSVEADFIGTETIVDLSLHLTARIGSLLALLIRILIAYLKRPRTTNKKTKRKSDTTAVTKA